MTTMPSATTDGFETIQAGYNLAQNLTQQYGSKHFYMSPPMNLTVDKSLAKQLNQNLWSEKRQYRLRNSTRFEEDECHLCAKGTFGTHTQSFAWNTVLQTRVVETYATKVSFRHVKSSFLQRFQTNIQQQKSLIQSEPCLANDFQVLVDTRGNFFQLDLDRCFVPGTSIKQNITNEELTECLQAIDSIEKQVKKAISRKMKG